mgnify:CR=1 FL=1
MRTPTISKLTVMLAVSLVAISSPARALAQHGHPLVGTWSGYWGQNAEQRNRVLLLLEYDGDIISGIINPGLSPAPITRASLDPETWTITLEGERLDTDGTVVHYLINGKIENVTSPNERAITGSWTEGTDLGDFLVTLN